MVELPSADTQMASLGLWDERFSTRLIQNPVNVKAPKYLDEYMDICKEDPETGNLTRYIISEPVTFSVEITLSKSFDYGVYDGVLVKLIDINSGIMIWKKKFPKGGYSGPPGEARKIIIDSIEAIADGKLMTNVNLSLGLLTDGDFFKRARSTSQQDQQNLEGLRIELCKYQHASKTDIASNYRRQRKMEATRKQDAVVDVLKRTAVHRTVYDRNYITYKLKLANGKPVSDEEKAQFLLPPTPCTRFCKDTTAQVFSYLWRGPKFFDARTIVKTPVSWIRLPWDVLPEVRRWRSYAELSQYDYDYVWKYHLKKLGPTPMEKSVTTLRDRLRSDLPPYWRSWSKLYSHERPSAFQKLQERRRYIDKGEIPADHKVIFGPKEVSIGLTVSPQQLHLVSGAVQIANTRSLLYTERRISNESTPNTGYELTLLSRSQDVEVLQDTTSPINPSRSILPVVPMSMADYTPPASSAPSKEVGISTAGPSIVTPQTHICDINTLPITTELIPSKDPVPTVATSSKRSFPMKLLPKIKTEHKNSLKRPAEFIDLTIPKRQVHKKVVRHSMKPLDITSPQSATRMAADHELMTGDALLPTMAFPLLKSPSLTPMTQKSTAQPVTVDVDNYIPSHSSFAAAIVAGAEMSTVKHDPDIKCEARVENNFTLPSIDLQDELRRLEEEAARAAIELEDAVRVAEARRQMNGVKRRIDQLKSRGRSFT